MEYDLGDSFPNKGKNEIPKFNGTEFLLVHGDSFPFDFEPK